MMKNFLSLILIGDHKLWFSGSRYNVMLSACNCVWTGCTKLLCKWWCHRRTIAVYSSLVTAVLASSIPHTRRETNTPSRFNTAECRWSRESDGDVLVTSDYNENHLSKNSISYPFSCLDSSNLSLLFLVDILIPFWSIWDSFFVQGPTYVDTRDLWNPAWGIDNLLEFS